jgi:hypothetical protein
MMSDFDRQLSGLIRSLGLNNLSIEEATTHAMNSFYRLGENAQEREREVLQSRAALIQPDVDSLALIHLFPWSQIDTEEERRSSLRVFFPSLNDLTHEGFLFECARWAVVTNRINTDQDDAIEANAEIAPAVVGARTTQIKRFMRLMWHRHQSLLAEDSPEDIEELIQHVLRNGIRSGAFVKLGKGLTLPNVFAVGLGGDSSTHHLVAGWPYRMLNDLLFEGDIVCNPDGQLRLNGTLPAEIKAIPLIEYIRAQNSERLMFNSPKSFIGMILKKLSTVAATDDLVDFSALIPPIGVEKPTALHAPKPGSDQNILEQAEAHQQRNLPKWRHGFGEFSVLLQKPINHGEFPHIFIVDFTQTSWKTNLRGSSVSHSTFKWFLIATHALAGVPLNLFEIPSFLWTDSVYRLRTIFNDAEEFRNRPSSIELSSYCWMVV